MSMCYMERDKLINKNKLRADNNCFFVKHNKFFAITALLFILFFLVATPISGDDVNYFALQSTNFEWLSLRYNTWTSRIVIDSNLPFMAKHEYIFKLITILLFLSAPIALYITTQKYKLSASLCILLIAIFPFYKLTSAGYAATMTNYFYPILFGLWVFVYLFIKKANIFGYLILMILTTYVVNHEQTAILLLVVSLIALFYKDSDKKLATLCLILSIVGLFFIFTCPGNTVRLLAESNTWLPGYENYELLDKINLGITSSLYFLNYRGPVAFLFCFASVMYVFTKKFNLSLALVIFLTILINLVLKKFIGPNYLEQDCQWLFRFPIHSFLILLAMPIALVILVLSMKISNHDKFVIIMIIACAYAIRCTMGFSPTVFASIERPSIFSHLLFILCGLFVLLRGNIEKKNIYVLITLFGMYGAANSLFRGLRAVHHAIFM